MLCGFSRCFALRRVAFCAAPSRVTVRVVARVASRRVAMRRFCLVLRRVPLHRRASCNAPHCARRVAQRAISDATRRRTHNATDDAPRGASTTHDAERATCDARPSTRRTSRAARSPTLRATRRVTPRVAPSDMSAKCNPPRGATRCAAARAGWRDAARHHATRLSAREMRRDTARCARCAAVRHLAA